MYEVWTTYLNKRVIKMWKLYIHLVGQNENHENVYPTMYPLSFKIEVHQLHCPMCSESDYLLQAFIELVQLYSHKRLIYSSLCQRD